MNELAFSIMLGQALATMLGAAALCMIWAKMK